MHANDRFGPGLHPKLLIDALQMFLDRPLVLVLVLLISVPLAWLATALPYPPTSAPPDLQVGQVAEQDYRASQGTTFVSEVMTEQRREVAARNIAPLYTSPDARVARKQMESLRNVLAYVNTVRADQYASITEKTSDLQSLEDIQLDGETAITLLGMTDTRWQAVQQESLVVLEKIMSSPIPPEGVQDARTDSRHWSAWRCPKRRPRSWLPWQSRSSPLTASTA